MDEAAPFHTDIADAPPGGAAFWLALPRGEIRAAVWKGGDRGTAIIFNGRTEYIEKYGRVAAELASRGFSVATLDWRGQGLSRRALDNPMKGHIADFASYQRDVQIFMNSPQVRDLPKPHVLICHSMGGCIGMRALLEQNVEPVAAIMSAPMLGIHMKPHMRLAANILVAISKRYNFRTLMTPAPNMSRPYVLAQPFEDNVLTGDRTHYDWMRRHLEAEPGFALGAPTLGWMEKAFEEMESLSLAPPPETPTLMYLGSEEEVVEPEAIRVFDRRTPQCRLVELPDARHEVFMETPAIQEVVWSEFDAFLAERGV